VFLAKDSSHPRLKRRTILRRQPDFRSLGIIESAEQPTLSEQDEAVETFGSDRAHKALGIGVGVRCLEGRQDDAHPRALHDTAESLRPRAVPVADEDPMARQEPIDGVGETPGRLGHECGIRIER
jgi:hypothetical protein